MENPKINSWKKWVILVKVALSEQSQYNKVVDLWDEIKEGVNSRPYFQEAINFLEINDGLKLIEHGDMKQVVLDKKKIVKICKDFEYFDFIQKFIVKTNLFAIT